MWEKEKQERLGWRSGEWGGAARGAGWLLAVKGDALTCLHESLRQPPVARGDAVASLGLLQCVRGEEEREVHSDGEVISPHS